jgi:carboxymethylenebutenolidase
MKEIQASELSQEVYDLFDDYVHDRISRRNFLNKVSKYTVAGMTASAILDFLAPQYVLATTQVAEDDPRLKTEFIEYDSPKGGGKIKAQLSRPVAAENKIPGIVIVHENRGLNPYIADVGRRAALAGFVTIAPDALTPLGGYPGNDDDGRALQRQRDGNEMLEDFIAAYGYLKNHPQCTGNIGVVGFCFGGWITNMMAVKIEDLKAAVPFYGTQPDSADVPKIQAPLLLHFASLDKRVNEGWPAYEAALKKNNKAYTAFIYPDVNHGFHNDTTPRYNKDAATLAWQRTIEFFNARLKS